MQQCVFSVQLLFCRDFTVLCSEEITIDRENPKWHYYFLCGVKGIQVRYSTWFTLMYSALIKHPDVFLLYFSKEKFGIAQLAGMSCLIEGTIPPSSGLSSSSALVCCAGLLTMKANQKSLTKVKHFTFLKKYYVTDTIRTWIEVGSQCHGATGDVCR